MKVKVLTVGCKKYHACFLV